MGYVRCDTFTFQSVLGVEHFNKDLFEEPCEDDNANVPYTPDACTNHEFMDQARIIKSTEEDQGLVRRRPATVPYTPDSCMKHEYKGQARGHQTD